MHSAAAALAELSAIPYENLSKVVAFHQGVDLESALSFSSTWLEDHRRLGLGGTCFSLTYWLKMRLETLGFSTAYVMADKRNARNIHCGLLLRRDGRDYLLDPGYLIFEPLPLPQSGLSTVTFSSPNEVRVEDVAAEGVWRLHSGPRGALKHRFDFRKQPVDAAEFQKHWEASYHWPMMRYPILNRVVDGTQYYLQKDNLLVRTVERSAMRKLSQAEFSDTATRIFGLEKSLVEEALGIFGKA